MTNSSDETRVLRVAVVGSGPAGFYTAESLLKATGYEIRIDMFDRLPTPFGLVRFGVAPDHLKIKNVTRAFDRIARNPKFRFFGNVDIGSHITVAELKQHYHLICFATGAQTDKRMGIPGEDFSGSHPATDFVAWYNGHPDYRHLEFNLNAERVAVVGIGNVAVDVARILCRTPAELRDSDIAEHALEALSRSRIREVYMLGRRGPAQAAFTTPEIKELGEMDDAELVTVAEEVALDSASQAMVTASGDDKLARKIEIIQSFSRPGASNRGKRLHLRFLVSPTELHATDGTVAAMTLVRNRLEESDGRLKAIPTGEFETVPVELVFRSVGYRGVAIPGLPMDELGGVIPNDEGRIVDPETGAALPGLYVSGWIKRGPTGVIGTNKPDAAATVRSMLADVAGGTPLQPTTVDGDAIARLVAQRQPHSISYADWQRLDDIEVELGERAGRPRVKIVSREEVRQALAGSAPL